MKLGITVGNLPGTIHDRVALVREAEALGFSSAWTSESWGRDAVTTASWLLAHTSTIQIGTGIMQMSARTPAMAAMTAMSLQEMSAGRFLMGIGPSGPQVIEGWHGEPFGKALGRTREYVSIVRQILARQGPLEHHGEHYQIPNTGPGTTGLGKALKTIMHPDPNLKIYTGSFTPAGIRVSAEIVDGTIPIFMDPERFDVFEDNLAKGFAKSVGGKSIADFDMAPYCRVVVDADLDRARDSLRGGLALYIGGMGARDKNFYNDYTCSLGYEDMAKEVQDLFLAGNRREAAGKVTDSFIDQIALVGSPDRIRDRLAAWTDVAKDGKIGTLIINGPTPESMRVVAEAVL
ncbi:MAG: LLM class F420-dependent oxidoreductase [Chromatiales bacterium]|jgi:F420-dependent oxidoreductase-like protein|nr:LLM class F420-dependent oxidoreductase [Chromatiales bacterium]